MIAEAAPGCVLQILHSAGHMSPLSHPDAVATIINNYISAI
jgi:pimeloyl-ACP methyl ester carboxylesterase